MKKYFKSLVLFFFITCVTQSAYGYIDPGTGSYLLQILIAGGLAGLYTVKTYWKNIHGFVARRFTRKK